MPQHAAGQLRVFLSPPDVLGFTSLDYILLVVSIAAFLVLVVANPIPFRSVRWPRIRPILLYLSFAILPVALRLCLLTRYPVPVGSGADDFGYLLLGDTLAHCRLANPPVHSPEFFEQIFVLQQPTRSSMFPLGQGLALASGALISGIPWVGVLIASALFSAALVWMLRSWIGERWAIVGGLVGVAQFGPLCYWMNCYWGGYLSATAGCLVFGAFGKLRQRYAWRYGVALGLGFAMQLLTRPFEFVLLAGSVCFFVPALWRLQRSEQVRTLAFALAVLLPASLLVLLQNEQVTGNAFVLPYQLYRHQYGTPATFTFQPNPTPTKILNEEQELDYRAETAIHGEERETTGSYLKRALFRLRFLRFFLSPALYLPFVIGAVYTVRERQRVHACLPILGALLVFAIGSNLYPYFYPHYVAAIAPCLLLIALAGLRAISVNLANGRVLAISLGVLALTPFTFWFGVRAAGTRSVLNQLASQEAWDFVNGPDPQGRETVDRKLASVPGRQLVFVQYSPGHSFSEWVHNGADLEGSQTIFVHDLGATANAQLQAIYPHRKPWLLQPDFDPPKLTPLRHESSQPFENVP
jgi:hypothetical protein